MAQRKISELPVDTNPTGAEELIVNDGGVSRKVTITNAVAAAGALMDSELTNITAVKAIDQGVATTDDVTFNTTTTKAQYLEALTNTLTGTAVATHIYIPALDDSDGGAWRYRTQHTSWYQETLNTATRGKTREFPAVAGIVVEDAKVTIYDMTDPDHAMWMVFETAGGSYYWISGYNDHDLRAAAMVNAEMVVVNYSGYNHGGVIRVRFLQDDVFATIYAGNKRGVGGLVNRNTSTNWVTVDDGNYIVSNAVNDVALTVLPNAPIDAATGLPVPTIAVATNGGVSVIDPQGDGSGTVKNILTSSWGPAPKGSLNVGFMEDTLIMDGQWWGYYTRPIFVIPLNSIVSGISADNQPNRRIYSNYTGFPYDLLTHLGYDSSGLRKLVTLPNHEFVFNAADSLDRYPLVRLKENPTTPAEGSVCYITSNSNSGWMTGDIKGAFALPTDHATGAGALDGSELVTNGTFDSDTSGWTLTGTGPFNASGGKGVLTAGASGDSVQQNITCVVGTTYILSYDTEDSREAYFDVRDSGGSVASTSGYTGGRSGTYFITFVATETTMIVRFDDGSGGAYQITVDNISVRKAIPDVSVNNNAIAVHGSLDVNPVATGADLLAVSGFGTSDYLEQPYNSDLDFGTGSFTVMLWMKPNTDGRGYFLYKHASENVVPYFDYYMYDDNRVRVRYGFSIEYSSINSIPYNVWSLLTVVRDSSGHVSLYVNGRLDNTWTAADNLDVASAVLTIGANNQKSNGFNGSLTLPRITGTALSAEEVRRHYLDERPLFNSGAACTLVGSSDAITALDYDKVTNELHAGTSGGRSVFQGLVRVAEDTSATSQSLVDIAAKDGMLLEGK